jgi:hypothetical protein
MKTIELQLNERTLERARQVAAFHRCTLEELIQEIGNQLGKAQAASDPVRGRLAPEPELRDQVMAAAMQAREKYPPSQSQGGA